MGKCITELLVLLATCTASSRALGERIEHPPNDSEVTADYQAWEKWLKEKGNSLGFFKENGPKRVEGWKATA